MIISAATKTMALGTCMGWSHHLVIHIFEDVNFGILSIMVQTLAIYEFSGYKSKG